MKKIIVFCSFVLFVVVLVVVVCGNLSKVLDEGFIENLVFFKIFELVFNYDGL